jgi:hypothetical protein
MYEINKYKIDDKEVSFQDYMIHHAKNRGMTVWEYLNDMIVSSQRDIITLENGDFWYAPGMGKVTDWGMSEDGWREYHKNIGIIWPENINYESYG